MPDASTILASLSEIARTGFPFAVGWHVLIAAAMAAVALGCRPSQRGVVVASSLPLASVAAFAWLHGNPFNGLVFSLLAVFLIALAVRVPTSAIVWLAPHASIPSAALVAFAWVYPHFLEAWRSPGAYFFGAPLGLVPCPTLALVSGVLLLTRASRAAAWVVGAASVFYGAFGAFKLGVWMDLLLLAGGLVLLVSTAATYVQPRRHAVP